MSQAFMCDNRSCQKLVNTEDREALQMFMVLNVSPLPAFRMGDDLGPTFHLCEKCYKDLVRDLEGNV
jgi:hypothetical protein